MALLYLYPNQNKVAPWCKYKLKTHLQWSYLRLDYFSLTLPFQKLLFYFYLASLANVGVELRRLTDDSISFLIELLEVLRRSVLLIIFRSSSISLSSRRCFRVGGACFLLLSLYPFPHKELPRPSLALLLSFLKIVLKFKFSQHRKHQQST